ncbi:MAG: hypothetical protein ABF318_19005, partial [Ketobacter sp.]
GQQSTKKDHQVWNCRNRDGAVPERATDFGILEEAKAVLRVLGSKDLRQSLIEGGSRVYAEGYCKDHIVQQYVEFYSRIRR